MSLIKRFFMNKSLYAIGDVHGCYETLIRLIDKLPNKEQSNLIFVGDLIDRGKDSAKALEFVRKGNYACVMGNHEKMFLEATDIPQSVDEQAKATKF